MINNLISLILFITIVFAEGGYDHGKSTGKGKYDISITWNPFDYFEYGQSYLIVGYGITDRLDIHGFYSTSVQQKNNYYGGFLYQFYKSKKLNVSTAVGIRKYTNNKITHIFFPQLLYMLKLSQKLNFGGSFVSIRSQNLDRNLGVALDSFFMIKFIENEKYQINLSLGAFNPVLWEPKDGDWYPTYSIDIKIK